MPPAQPAHQIPLPSLSQPISPRPASPPPCLVQVERGFQVSRVLHQPLELRHLWDVRYRSSVQLEGTFSRRLLILPILKTQGTRMNMAQFERRVPLSCCAAGPGRPSPPLASISGRPWKAGSCCCRSLQMSEAEVCVSNLLPSMAIFAAQLPLLPLRRSAWVNNIACPMAPAHPAAPPCRCGGCHTCAVRSACRGPGAWRWRPSPSPGSLQRWQNVRSTGDGIPVQFPGPAQKKQGTRLRATTTHPACVPHPSQP